MDNKSQSVVFTAKKTKKRCEQCCISGCKNNKADNASCRLFTFPKCQIMRNKWLSNCGLPSTFTESELFICDKHFESNYVGKKN